MRGWDKLTQRAVTQPFILAMQFMTLFAMRAQHLAVHLDPMRAEAMLAALFAAFIGMAVFRSVNNRQFTQVLNALLMVSGALMVPRAY